MNNKEHNKKLLWLRILLAVVLPLVLAACVWAVTYLHRSPMEDGVGNTDLYRMVVLKGNVQDALDRALEDEAHPAGLYDLTVYLGEDDTLIAGEEGGTALFEVLSLMEGTPAVLRLSDTGARAQQAVDILAEVLDEEGMTGDVYVLPADSETARYLDESFGEECDVYLQRAAMAEEAAELVRAARENRAGWQPKYPLALCRMREGMRNNATAQTVNYASCLNVYMVYLDVETQSDMEYLMGIGAYAVEVTDADAFMRVYNAANQD